MMENQLLLPSLAIVHQPHVHSQCVSYRWKHTGGISKTCLFLAQQHYKTSTHYQGDNLMNNKVEVKQEAEETYVNDEEEVPPEISADAMDFINIVQVKEEDFSLEISIDGKYRRYNAEDCSSPECEKENSNATEKYTGENAVTSSLHSVFFIEGLSADSSKHNGCQSLPIAGHTASGNETYPCSECGKVFMERRNLIAH